MIYTEHISDVRRAIAECGRDVTVVAAVKMQTVETVDELMRLAPDFVLGENRVQELTAKYNPAYRWHFIGQLQTNKVKYIIDKVELIHSLDRTELAEEIVKQAAKHGKTQACLVEVNMGGELSKGGVSPDKAADFVKSLKGVEGIRIEGLMSVLPNLGDCAELRSMYADLKSLYDEISEIWQDNAEIKYLSAGMSNDYEIALEYGANVIRLGRTLFGERIYPADVNRREER